MYNLLKITFILNLFTSLNFVAAEIHEIKNMKEVLNYLDPKIAQIVVFDIDNTLLSPADDLGSDQWFSHLVKQHVANGRDQIAACDQVLPTYFHIQNYINLVPTELDLVASIKAIEQACAHTICLTARSPLKLINVTLEQLAKNKLTFNVPEFDHVRLALPENSIYQDGVLFCGHSCKGLVLRQFLDACHYTPTQIILVDDKLYNLQSVEKQLNLAGIQFIGLRYAGCDERIANFDFDRTNQDLESFLSKYPLLLPIG